MTEGIVRKLTRLEVRMARRPWTVYGGAALEADVIDAMNSERCAKCGSGHGAPIHYSHRPTDRIPFHSFRDPARLPKLGEPTIRDLLTAETAARWTFTTPAGVKANSGMGWSGLSEEARDTWRRLTSTPGSMFGPPEEP